MAKSKLKATQLAIVDGNNEYIVHEFEKQGLVVKTKEQLKSAISKLSSSEGTIIVVDNIIIDENITVPENVMLKFYKGGKLTVNTRSTLTINGGIEAGLYYIFDGSGAISGNLKVEAIYPEWFGAKGDGVNDDINAIQKAINLALLCKSKKVKLVGKYNITKPIQIPPITENSGGFYLSGTAQTEIIKSTTNVGQGSNTQGTKTDDYGKDSIIIIEHANNTFSYYVTLENLFLSHTIKATTSYGIYAPRLSHCTFRNLKIFYCTYGFVTHDAWMCTLDKVQAQGKGIDDNSYGFLWDGNNTDHGVSGTSLFMNNCWARDVRYGYRFGGLSYSTLNSCGADHIGVYHPDGGMAYHFTSCHGITLNGCCSENIKIAPYQAVFKFELTNAVMNGCRYLDARGGASGEIYPVQVFSNGRVAIQGCRFEDISSSGATVFRFPATDSTSFAIISSTRLPTSGNTFYAGVNIFIDDMVSADVISFNTIQDSDTYIRNITVPNGKTLVVLELERYSLSPDGLTKSVADFKLFLDNGTIIYDGWGKGIVNRIEWTNTTGAGQNVRVKINNGGNTGYRAIVRCRIAVR